MAGIKARGFDMALEIEMIMDLQNLVKGAQEAERIMKSAGVSISNGMNAADHAVAEAGVSMARLRREAQALKDRLDPLGPAQRQYAQELRNANAMMATGMVNQKQYAQAVEFAEQKLDAQTLAIQRNLTAGKQANAMAGAQRAGMQQLSYQLGDAATMWAMGAKPMQIFASQSGQVLQAVQLMTGGTSKLAGFLGGPWGIAMMAATTILVPLIGKLWETDEALSAVEKSAKDALAAFYTSLQATSQLSEVLTQQSTKRINALADEARLTREVKQTREAIAAASRFGSIDPGPMYSILAKQEKDLAKARKAAAEADRAARDAIAAQQLRDRMDARGGSLMGNPTPGEPEKVNESTSAHRGRTAALTESQRAYKQQYDATANFIESLQDEIAKIGLDEKALRQLQIAKEIEAAQTDDQKRKIEDLSKAREAAIAIAEKEKAVETASKALADFREKTIADLDIELQTMELVGVERDREILRLRHQAEMTALAADIRKAETAENWKLVEVLRETGRAYEEAYSKGQQVNGIKQRIEDTERLNDELRDTISILQQIGGVGGAIGKTLGFLSGDYGSIGGKLGSLLDMSFTKKGADGKEIAVKIGDELKNVFGIEGEFAKTLSSTLKGAGMGAAIGDSADGIMKALGIKSSNTGAQIGGAIGGMTGNPLIALGASIAGGLIGGLFKKAKWGRATLSSGSSDFAVEGNKSKYRDAASEAGNSIVNSLNQIAEQLGGTVGAFKDITVGIRDGKWRVNTTGTSLKTSKGAKDFGEDAEAAVAYAMAQAVKAGAITGLRESTLTLLKAGDDFQVQLQKAITFESVFSDLKAELDPLGFELDQIGKKFASLRTVFAEANATAEEMAQLEQLQQLQEQKARAAAAADAAAKRANTLEKEAELLALQGKATASLAKSREAELIQMDASHIALQKQINAEQDAATRRQLQVQLLEAQGNARAAELASRVETLRATLDENKALQERIWLSQDLRDAYDREGEALRTTAEEMKALGDTLRDFRASIYGTDNSAMSYTQALAKMIQTGSLAVAGDKTALTDLPGAGRDYLDVAKNSAKSLLDYQRAQALVANYADKAIDYTDTEASLAEQQLAQMEEQVRTLISIDENTQSVEDALNKLVMHNQVTANASNAETPADPSEREDLRKSIDRLSARFDNMIDGIKAIARSSASTDRTLRNVTRDGTTLATVPDA